jgi:hypothetical protein
VTRTSAVCAYGCLIAGSLLALDYRFYRRYLDDLAGRNVPKETLESMSARKKLPSDLLHSLGAAAHPREGRFTSFPLRRADGSIRIGAFGDSFTYGEEVGPRLDFPSQLGALFRQAGFRNVEVLNFGNPWHGFHQSYRLWDQLGRRYGLDVVLLGPATFFPERDVTFDHGLPSTPYYIHGRYILKGGEPIFEDVIGRHDFHDRFLNYFRFLPRWRYLRYDAKAPAFLRALVVAGRDVANPFYYRNPVSLEAELGEIDRALLRRLAGEVKQTVLLSTRPEIVDMARGLAPSLHAELREREQAFPCLRYMHYSAAGNALIARSYFDLLTGKGATKLTRLEFHARIDPRPFRSDAASLADFSRVYWTAAGAPLAGFEYILPYDDRDAPVDFRGGAIESLLAFRSPEQGLFDLLFIPSVVPLSSGTRASLKFNAAGKNAVSDLGEVRAFDRRLGIGFVPFDGIEAVRRPDLTWKLRLDPLKLARRGIDLGIVRSGSVCLGDREIADLIRAKDGGVFLEPRKKALVWIKPGRDMAVDIDRLPAAGTAVLNLAGPRVLRIPLAVWKKTQRYEAHDSAGLAFVIARSTANPAVAVLRPR